MSPQLFILCLKRTSLSRSTKPWLLPQPHGNEYPSWAAPESEPRKPPMPPALTSEKRPPVKSTHELPGQHGATMTEVGIRGQTEKKSPPLERVSRPLEPRVPKLIPANAS